MAGKTLSGEKVIEKMKAPQISIIDLIQDLRFNLGYALASVISYRNGDKKPLQQNSTNLAYLLREL